MEMSLRAYVVRGLAKEVEESLNKLLAGREPVQLVQVVQSESGDHITVTLVVDEPDPRA
jgi:hypothetical protein